MTMIAATALAGLLLLGSTTPTAAQAPSVQAVMADHAAEVCAPGPQRATPAGELRCDAAGKLAEFEVFVEGTQRVEVLIRWSDLAAGPCLRPTPRGPSARRAGTAPAPAQTPPPPPPPPPTPEAVIAACDGALAWLERFEVALTDDRARAEVAPEPYLNLGQAHRIRGEALTTLEGVASPRACAAFAAGRQAVRHINLSSVYARSHAESFRTQIAEVEAAGAACP